MWPNAVMYLRYEASDWLLPWVESEGKWTSWVYSPLFGRRVYKLNKMRFRFHYFLPSVSIHSCGFEYRFSSGVLLAFWRALSNNHYLINHRSHAAKCGTTWFCHIPFCPEVKGIPSFEWLKIKEGETKGNSQKLQEFPNHFWLIS